MRQHDVAHRRDVPIHPELLPLLGETTGKQGFVFPIPNDRVRDVHLKPVPAGVVAPFPSLPAALLQPARFAQVLDLRPKRVSDSEKLGCEGRDLTGAYFGITGTQDGTHVSLKLGAAAQIAASGTIQAAHPGDTVAFALDAGDVAEIRAPHSHAPTSRNTSPRPVLT